ncbi:cobyrinate a,c-diamide synthase [Desulfococcaceae bacterium HSG8]|nr:cobyrinate a,c-diamide synthase [Desulfococcaceae bacterium HSG8]
MDKTIGYVIAGTNSGSGKTTISLGIMAWLQKQGYKVAPFKAGPDFIDPGHHTRITGTASRNLDGWMLSREYNLDIFRRYSAHADIAIVEGVMGLYDGYDGKSEAGSTAQMAKWLSLPVILIVNAKSMARSAAALIKGFVEFDPEVNFAGVVFNNLGSKNHLKYLEDATREYLSVPVLGGILRNDRITMPERHLGLVTDDEHMLKQEDTDLLSDMIGEGIDTKRLLKGVRSGKIKEKKNLVTNSPPFLKGAGGIFLAKKGGCDKNPPFKKGGKNLQVAELAEDSSLRIGIARDAAFCFYYQDNLDMLESEGAALVFFSPTDDKKLPENLSGIYFGGGYPEVFADRLSRNRTMRSQVRQASQSGMPIYGECGGFMYLCDQFIGEEGRVFPMTGCFPFSTRLLNRLRSLGYREVVLKENAIVGSEGMKARGHEFHYSEIADPVPDIRKVYAISGRTGRNTRKEGFCVNNTLGSYVHLHFGSNPGFCSAFVESCRNYYTTF